MKKRKLVGNFILLIFCYLQVLYPLLKVPNKNRLSSLELETFLILSESSTSIIKNLPKEFFSIYKKSNGTPQSMFTNCLETFITLLDIKDSKLEIETTVLKISEDLYVPITNLKDKYQVRNISISEAVKYFCMRAISILFSRDKVDLFIKRLNSESFLYKEDLNKDSNYIKLGDYAAAVKAINMLFKYDLDKTNYKRTNKQYKRKEMKLPLYESRLRNRIGTIVPGSKNYLGVPNELQIMSDKIKINKEKKMSLENMDVNRSIDLKKEELVANALKRMKSLDKVPKAYNKSLNKYPLNLNCKCEKSTICECNLMDIYGQTLGLPISLELEKEFFTHYQVKNTMKNKVKEEIAYYKKITDPTSGEFRKSLKSPRLDVIIPVSSLSRMQMQTLDQLAGLDVETVPERVKSIPPIRESDKKKYRGKIEPVPVIEDLNFLSISNKGNKDLKFL
ncbi:uncharacterized protein CMU_039080 [Cryptosporidium muris RN66]|uniref:Uncharacterized protein n=1 Tax=Cryptosporidium muris (strain RN66) TaxID=441375 RepID=B6A9F0_CRYMR|nr:uncharacterized protein CMU_039080 [Cryptosporidium muris RN66]EEA04841.1 hypothetical protein, conserved [Cryptosporidium muris RN66]|eukprot:XP_002139190.1 hypothetical protein [Cryptosporidium muris RN66]